ncbi:tripartite tricarboxylate transporter substrate binding protein [Plastoroseomonas arctica]|uniref:Tripartite tricarboxylate transporter substrate binding protein n=1 Tax=Plastoroseomonas arctica TaxID=1509237 RepID=A0AAF1JYL6_9PROT|nr:tripartite tricarboxylate transporter substrate binding protein [Plastoroseomonas arctica]MBR0656065.1 tripartite tricarboxylate transporter substrate binding protein [Plastoroseomonas arctica]
MRALALAFALLAVPAIAQEAFPSRPIQIINPYQAGGATDTLTRVLAAAMAERLGQPMVVINRDGAAGAVGTAQGARAAPDGHTLVFAPALVLSVLPVTQAGAGYGPDALRPVCQAFSNAQAILVRADSPLRSLSDLVSASHATPGGLAYCTLGIASIPHMAMLQWLAASGAAMPHIPYRGDGPVITEVLAGRIPAGAVVLASASGRTDVRLLAVFDTARNPGFPDVPTAIEQGFDVAPTSFGGVFAPRAVSDARVAVLEAACMAAARSESYRAAARRALQPAAYFADAAVFGERLARDIAEKAALLRTIRPAE